MTRLAVVLDLKVPVTQAITIDGALLATPRALRRHLFSSIGFILLVQLNYMLGPGIGVLADLAQHRAGS
jgi:hypothetical protein